MSKGLKVNPKINEQYKYWSNVLGQLKYVLYLLKRNFLSVIGVGIVGFVLLVAIFAPYLATNDPLTTDMHNRERPPFSSGYIMGTDSYGMDIYSRIVWASRIDLMIASLGVFFTLLFGVPIGAIVGYYGGLLDNIIMRILDSQQAFPTYILAMLMIIALGQSLTVVIAVLVFVNYPTFVRLVRAQMMTVKETQYADAARCLGYSNFRIIFRHLLPNCIGPIFVQASICAGRALLLAAGLSFLGLGVRIPTAEWGLMVSMGVRNVIRGQWWISFLPGIAIFITVLGFYLLGDGLQDVFDPKRR